MSSEDKWETDDNDCCIICQGDRWDCECELPDAQTDDELALDYPLPDVVLALDYAISQHGEGYLVSEWYYEHQLGSFSMMTGCMAIEVHEKRICPDVETVGEMRKAFLEAIKNGKTSTEKED